MIYEFIIILLNNLFSIWYITYDNFKLTSYNFNFLIFLNNNINLNNLLSYIKIIFRSDIYDFKNTNHISYKSENINLNFEKVYQILNMSELSSVYRYQRFNNAMVSYDYKTGNYINC